MISLRTEIEALIVEFDHHVYRGAPLDVAMEKLREILAKTKPKVLTTLEELDSEKAKKALCLIAADGQVVGFYDRDEGELLGALWQRLLLQLVRDD